MACQDTKLAGNYLMVAVLSKTGKVLVTHAITQNWQVIKSIKRSLHALFTKESQKILIAYCVISVQDNLLVKLFLY